MDAKRLNPELLTQSPSGNGRRRARRSSDCNSPEFEFWMVRNPSFPQPNLLSADELFVDGVLMPLHLLSGHNKPDPPDKTLHPDLETPDSEPLLPVPVTDPDPESRPVPESSPAITESATPALSPSKRWRDIFRKSDKKNAENNTNPEEKENEKEKEKEKEKGKKNKERKGGNGFGSTELNINIWPFSRSRSAGNAGTRPKLFPGAPGTRKVNSAPCSRSNSAGESKSRKWPSSPGRAGVHIGRSSPVWQVRRGSSVSTSKNPEPLALNPEKGSKRETPTSRRSKVVTSSSTAAASAKAKVLNLNAPTCIDYRHNLNCRSDENNAIGVNRGGDGDGGGGGGNIHGDNGGGNGGGDGGVGGKLFNLRSLFTKKSVVTSH